MIGFGVPAGAINPPQPGITNSRKPESAMVGSDGSNSERCAVLTARPRRAPDSICGFALVDTPKNTCVTPPIVAAMPELTSRYGTWTMSTPPNLLTSSQARCGTVPIPADAQLSPPGCALA